MSLFVAMLSMVNENPTYVMYTVGTEIMFYENNT